MTEWKPREDQCDFQLDCERFEWRNKPKNEHVRRMENCKKMRKGYGCCDLRGQSCDLSKMRRIKEELGRITSEYE